MLIARDKWFSAEAAGEQEGPVESQFDQREVSVLTLILVIVLVILVIGAIPAWPYSSGWGYSPMGLLGLILVIVLILWLLGIL